MRSTITLEYNSGKRGGFVMDHSTPFDPVVYLRNNPGVYEVAIESVEPDEDGNRAGFCLNRDQIKPHYL